MFFPKFFGSLCKSSKSGIGPRSCAIDLNYAYAYILICFTKYNDIYSPDDIRNLKKNHISIYNKMINEFEQDFDTNMNAVFEDVFFKFDKNRLFCAFEFILKNYTPDKQDQIFFNFMSNTCYYINNDKGPDNLTFYGKEFLVCFLDFLNLSLSWFDNYYFSITGKKLPKVKEYNNCNLSYLAQDNYDYARLYLSYLWLNGLDSLYHIYFKNLSNTDIFPFRVITADEGSNEYISTLKTCIDSKIYLAIKNDIETRFSISKHDAFQGVLAYLGDIVSYKSTLDGFYLDKDSSLMNVFWSTISTEINKFGITLSARDFLCNIACLIGCDIKTIEQNFLFDINAAEKNYNYDKLRYYFIEMYDSQKFLNHTNICG